jgi:ABC-type polar amino acid transport system ATPase subunit
MARATSDRSSGPPAAVAFEDVAKWFGAHQVLQDISLEVAEGEVLVICGASGSGKSTLLRCINRLEAIQQGRILLFGKDSHMREGIAQTGMVFQSFNLYPHKTALQNVTLAPMMVKRLTRREAEATGMALLDRVGVAEKAAAYPSQLSGGQQQRVAIARALAMAPRIMLFDEPTSALDPEMIKEVLDVMVDLAVKGMTMIVVTHEMGFARRVAHRIAYMDQGRILEIAPAEEFFGAPRNERLRQFLSSILDR